MTTIDVTRLTIALLTGFVTGAFLAAHQREIRRLKERVAFLEETAHDTLRVLGAVLARLPMFARMAEDTGFNAPPSNSLESEKAAWPPENEPGTTEKSPSVATCGADGAP